MEDTFTSVSLSIRDRDSRGSWRDILIFNTMQINIKRRYGWEMSTIGKISQIIMYLRISINCIDFQPPSIKPWKYVWEECNYNLARKSLARQNKERMIDIPLRGVERSSVIMIHLCHPNQQSLSSSYPLGKLLPSWDYCNQRLLTNNSPRILSDDGLPSAMILLGVL